MNGGHRAEGGAEGRGEVVDRLERIRRAGQVSWALVGLAVVVVLLGLVAWWVRIIWPPLILAGAIVFILHPVVTALQHRHVPRVAGVTLSYLGFFAIVGLGVLALVPLASDQIEELEDEWPQLREDVEDWINDLHEQSQDWPIQIPSVGELEDQASGDGDDDIGDRIDQVRDLGGRVFHLLLIVILAPILAFYMLIDLPRIGRVARSLIPEHARPEVLHVAARLNGAIGGFFRGQLMVALIVGLMVSAGLAAIDLPFWLLVGMIAGLFNIIPLIGPWVGAVPGIIIALTTRDFGTAVWVGVIMAGAQQIDNHVISPLVMKRAVKLHPAAVMVALLAGGALAGFFGLLIAVPTAATLKILVGHLWRTHVLGEPFAEVVDEEGAADAAPGTGVVRDVTEDTGDTEDSDDSGAADAHGAPEGASDGGGSGEGRAGVGAPPGRA